MRLFRAIRSWWLLPCLVIFGLGIALTDATLKELATLTELRSLKLGGTQVTDAGLAELTVLRKLRELALEKTNVTDEGVRELRRALPEVRVVR